jgi:hypothetical protein
MERTTSFSNPHRPADHRTSGRKMITAFLMFVKRAKIDGLGAAIPCGADLVSDQLARYEYLHAGGLDIVDMHKNIGAAAIRRDEAISTSRVEELNPPTRHAH